MRNGDDAWSTELEDATRAALAGETALLELAVKHTRGRFGLLSREPAGGFRVVEHGADTVHLFPDTAALLTAGWVVD